MEHPDSKVSFEGLKVPFFKEAKKLVLDSVEKLPNKLIGWDVAITKTGPVIVEANASPHIPMSDMAYGGLLRNKHIKEV